jgi:thiamine biosynthesis lipoprotein
VNSRHANVDTHRLRFNAMGCPCEITLEHADDEQVARRAAVAARAEVERLDAKYSHYRNDNLLAEIITAAADAGGATVDDETADLLDFSAALHAQSGGRFDITAGVLTKLWDLQAGRVPADAEVAGALTRTGWQRVRWNRPQLYFSTPGMRLDFGGVVKEYAADRAAQCCRDNGVAHGVVDLGGDLAVVGAHADGSAWRAGIKAPRAHVAHEPVHAFASIELVHGGLATSGDYERAMIVDGRRYSHIIDPRSGQPVASFASVSVLGESCLVAGAASTIGMLLGPREGYAWLQQLGLPFLCVSADGAVSGTLAAAGRP